MPTAIPISEGVANTFSIVGTIITAITGNVWLVIPFVAILIGVAIKVVKKLKRV